VSTTRENILLALLAALQNVAGPTVRREEVLGERVPTGGLVTLWDGDPGEPEITMSPLQYHYEHKAEIEVIVQAAKSTDRALAFDALIASVGTIIAADTTLGGLCDWVEASAPKPIDLPVIGGETMKAASIPVTLIYSSADPLV